MSCEKVLMTCGVNGGRADSAAIVPGSLVGIHVPYRTGTSHVPRYTSAYGRGVAQPGSAPAWGAGGRVFESLRPDQRSQGPWSATIRAFFMRVADPGCRLRACSPRAPTAGGCVAGTPCARVAHRRHSHRDFGETAGVGRGTGDRVTRRGLQRHRYGGGRDASARVAQRALRHRSFGRARSGPRSIE